ncbi:MAG: TIGR04076 family protein [Oscillospiraceae bacterium]|nr:TIGR04076 family protein [Oscillospiraceae bacterium]
MEHGCKVTVNDKKLFPELQQQYCAVPDSGKCPCFNVGDEFLFYRNDERDDYWHASAGTLVKSGAPDEGCLQSPGTMHCGTEGVPFCTEAWDAISRYIYTALQGGNFGGIAQKALDNFKIGTEAFMCQFEFAPLDAKAAEEWDFVPPEYRN